MMKEIKSEGMWRNVEEARGKGESDDDSHGADGGRVLVVMVRITMMIKMMMMMVIAVMVMMVMMVTDGSGGIFVPFCVAVTKIPENKPFEGSRMCFSSWFESFMVAWAWQRENGTATAAHHRGSLSFLVLGRPSS